MARIPYVEKDQAPPEIAVLFGKMEANGAPVGNIWKMSAHVPATLPFFIRMGNALLTKTKLSPKLREMAILRVAELLDCEYERRGHRMFGKEVGMTDQQVEAVKDWESSTAFDEAERAVLRFADEVATRGRVADETFAALARHLDDDRMVELAQTIGFYGMIARIALPFQIDLSERAPTSSSQITGRRNQA